MPEPSASQPLTDTTARTPVLRKLHALTGVVPTSLFVMAHLWTNASALQGQARFDGAVTALTQAPYRPVLEIVLLGALGFHAVVGLTLTLRRAPDWKQGALIPRGSTSFQRITGLVALVFIAFHLWGTWLPRATGRLTPEQLYPTLSESLSSTSHGLPITALIYLIGVLVVVLHATHGLWRVGVLWGLTASRRARRLSAALLGLAAVALYLLGANTVVHFATGAGLVRF